MQEDSPLVLEILRQGEMLKISAFEQNELALTLRHYSQCPVAFSEINKLCQEVISILNKANAKNVYSQDLIKGLTKAGQLLWEHLFTRQAKEKLRSTQILDLILSIDEELIDIPWELLHDGSSFLCLRFNVGRVVRTKEQITPPQYRSSSGILKMLILANPTNDLKSAYLEGLNIKNKFDWERKSVHIDFKSTHIDKLYVKKCLSDYDIVHFAGHCEYESGNTENSGWVLSDGRFTIRDVLTMGSTLSMPALVFSNACHSAKEVFDLIDADYQERNYSLACAFLFSGVRHYIGAIRKIEDPVSMKFSMEFYTCLISGMPVGESVRQARLGLIKEYGINAMHWSSYILYGDPGFILFRGRGKPAGLIKKKNTFFYKQRLSSISIAVAVISISIYLYIRLPTINPNTYRLFLMSQKLSQDGRNQEAILRCSSIIKIEPLFLAAYALLADTYLKVGDKANALKYYFDYALLSERRGDKKNLTFSYIAIGWVNHLYGDYAKAFDFYNKAISLSQENKDKLNEARALRKLAVWHMDNNDYVRSLELLTRSSEINRERQHIYEHRHNLACDYFDIGLVFANKDDYISAKEFYKKSQALFERLKLKSELSDYYFNLGEIYLFEKQYQKAKDLYSMGLKIDQAQGNKMNLASDYNMIAELYVEMDNLGEAQELFNKAVIISKEINARPDLAEAYYNLGLLYKRLDRIDEARGYFSQAEEIYGELSPALEK
jgi:CHAT domain-containing protein/tetratricopeptide (TPR) repeat protein